MTELLDFKYAENMDVSRVRTRRSTLRVLSLHVDKVIDDGRPLIVVVRDSERGGIHIARMTEEGTHSPGYESPYDLFMAPEELWFIKIQGDREAKQEYAGPFTSQEQAQAWADVNGYHAYYKSVSFVKMKEC
jgi:hypothetical protein